MCYHLGLINSHCFLFHTYFIPKPNSLTNNANFFIIASMKTSGDHYRNYQDDRNAQSQDSVYTTSNVCSDAASVRNPTSGAPVATGPPPNRSHFDRERIPERVVHAKGSVAHGVYKMTHALDDICLTDTFQEVRNVLSLSAFQPWESSPALTTVPVILVVSLKFKIDDGNWDLVANNVARNSSNAPSSADFSLDYQVTIVDRDIGS